MFELLIEPIGVPSCVGCCFSENLENWMIVVLLVIFEFKKSLLKLLFSTYLFYAKTWSNDFLMAMKKKKKWL
jgi:hypothetical protein